MPEIRQVFARGGVAMKLHLSGTSVGLAIGITVAVSAASAAGAYLYSLRHFHTLVDTARESALSQGELVRAALEHGMMEDDRTLTARMIRSFANEPGVSNVMLLDRNGVVQQSSGAVASGSELSLGSPTCQACHKDPPELRTTSRVLETQGGAILRTVVPVPNRPECHGCHDPARRINGLVILDMDAGTIRAAANHDLRWMAIGTAALALVLIASIALIVRVFVLRRLQRFETTARQISEGRLDRRVPSEGTDTISWLAREFNVMADSVTGLLGEVRDQRERLETVINSIDDGIVVLDRDRRVVAANDAFLARTGAGRDLTLGCPCSQSTGAVCGGCDCPTVACLESGQRQVRIFEWQPPDGSVRCEEVHASPITDATGRTAHIVEVWRDITTRRAAEARLAESHRLASLGMLASGFSHEMNTPLATVLTCVEGIARDASDDNSADGRRRIHERAAIAREQVLRCRGITQHFLRLSRGHAAVGEIVDIRETVAAVVRLIEPTARDKGVAVVLSSMDGAALRVRAAEADLQHAFMNLLLNAVQATSSGGTVTVGFGGGRTAVVRVTDTGCGIPPEHQKRIFEPFFSLRNGGTGLGLFLTLNFVRAWGGDVTVHSVPGEGSSFAVTLPPLVSMQPAVA